MLLFAVGRGFSCSVENLASSENHDAEGQRSRENMIARDKLSLTSEGPTGMRPAVARIFDNRTAGVNGYQFLSTNYQTSRDLIV